MGCIIPLKDPNNHVNMVRHDNELVDSEPVVAFSCIKNGIATSLSERRQHDLVT